MKEYILEKIAQSNPECEIWWDSSPLLYKAWSDDVVKRVAHDRKACVSAQVARLFNPDNPNSTLVRGVTTNPPLCLAAIKQEPQKWVPFIHSLIELFPDNNVEQIYWKTYKEMIRQSAKQLFPLFTHSNKKYGYVSAQLDPRYAFNFKVMINQALELQSISPNIMVKCPGTKQGYRVIEALTAIGVATNNTSSFSVPQYFACMDAVSAGLARARENSVDLSNFRSVITHMSDRFSFLGDLQVQAKNRGIVLSEEEIRLGELAIFKRAYFELKKRSHPSKMLMCSMRNNSPRHQDDRISSWHIEKLSGADVVYTCPPSYLFDLINAQKQMCLDNSHAIDETIPESCLNKLLSIPYFRAAYEPNGMTQNDFNYFAPLLNTLNEFSKATREMVDFVAQQMDSQSIPV